MALNLSNIIVSRIGTTSERIFHINLCTNYTFLHTCKRLFDHQILNAFLAPDEQISMFCLILLLCQLALNFVSFTFLSTLFCNVFKHYSIAQLHTYKVLNYHQCSNFMLTKFQMTSYWYHHSYFIHAISIYLSIYILQFYQYCLMQQLPQAKPPL